MPEDPLLRLEATYLTGSERRLAVFYAERFGRWQFNEMVADWYFKDDPDGGGTRNSVSVLISYLKKKLAPAGLMIEAKTNTGFRRMMWINREGTNRIGFPSEKGDDHGAPQRIA